MSDVLTAAQGFVRANVQRRRITSLARMLDRSGLFDRDWYLKNNPDVAATKIDPLVHFLRHGASEGRDPSEHFSTLYYLEANPDVASSGINPLVHYASHGAQEGRRPCPNLGEGFASYPFEKLSCHGLAQVTEYMARTATPAHLLARPDAQLYSPLISIILPIWNTSPLFLREVLQSIYCQTYTNWELCIVDDSSTNPSTLDILDAIKTDPRIRFARTPENSGIAVASHLGLSIASGEYVAFVDHDDLVVPTALSEVVGLLREDRTVDYVYSDHLQADSNGLPRSLGRKPKWSPEFLLSTNYIVHFKVVRRELLVSVGGLEREKSHVQDLGMTLRLYRAGAKIKHLPLGLYYWREHSQSVAMTTESKPGIEGLLVDEYDKHSRERGNETKHFWPERFRRDRVGVFEIMFPAEASSTTIVAIAPPSSSPTVQAIRERLKSQLTSATGFHIIGLSASQERDGITVLKSDEAVKAFFRKLKTDYIVLITAAGRCISPQGFSALTGYLQLDENIGAVGAKILDGFLQVKAGGLLAMESGAYGLIAGDRRDDDTGHWYNNQIASNVDAVSQRCMAVRRRDLVDGPGLMLHQWGELASLIFCQDLVSKGRRVVYNPTVKIYDQTPLRLDHVKHAQVTALSRKISNLRVYQEM